MGKYDLNWENVDGFLGMGQVNGPKYAKKNPAETKTDWEIFIIKTFCQRLRSSLLSQSFIYLFYHSDFDYRLELEAHSFLPSILESFNQGGYSLGKTRETGA